MAIRDSKTQREIGVYRWIAGTIKTGIIPLFSIIPVAIVAYYIRLI
jgi:hypothetical protein